MCILHVQDSFCRIFTLKHNRKRQEGIEQDRSACLYIQASLNRAVDSCIERGILKEFLLKNRAEVLGMLLEEFDAEKYERTIRREGWEEGEVKVNRLGLHKLYNVQTV